MKRLSKLDGTDFMVQKGNIPLKRRTSLSSFPLFFDRLVATIIFEATARFLLENCRAQGMERALEAVQSDHLREKQGRA